VLRRTCGLAREAATSDDRVAAENFYQHAEHYFRINNVNREANQQGSPPGPATPADIEMNSSETGPSEVQVERPQPRWDDDQGSL
jgi:uncharacterized protein DUF4167